METLYELYVTVTVTEAGDYEWGIGQYLENGDDEPEFEFLAGGQEDTLEDASSRISEEIKTLF